VGQREDNLFIVCNIIGRFAVENERISHGGYHVHIYALDRSSFFMLAVGVVGAAPVSHRLDSDDSVPDHWFNNEWTFFFPYCIDYAARESSSWTGSKAITIEIS
jgi:hypothetical protein